MSKKNRPTKRLPGDLEMLTAVMARQRRAEYVDALRDGRRVRAHTFTDRRKEASRRACRKGRWD
jgi:hypothetical protein